MRAASLPLHVFAGLRRALAAAILLLLSTLPVQAQEADIAPEAASGFGAIKAGTAATFMAVTANPHATDAAYRMLERGGSAVDAAIAAQMVLGLTEPQSSGIGGGAFLLHWDAYDKQLTAWDGRETAPTAVTPEHFLLPSGEPMPFFEAVVGGHAVGVPGVVAMLARTHEQYGELPWSDLFQPAIELAQKGFEISPRLHRLLHKMPHLAVNPEIRAYFFTGEGHPKPVGTVLRNPDYARTLSLLAGEGPEVFYKGALAKKIADAVQRDPNRAGPMTEKDLAGYRAERREPVCGDYRAYRVCGMPPPTSGGTTVIGILGMLQHLDTARLPVDDPRRLHAFAEASRLAFADRNRYVADPDFVAVPTEGLVDAGYLKRRARLISLQERMEKAPVGTPPGSEALELMTGRSPELASTSHLSVVDGKGNVVSMTSSIETGFGSRIMVGGFLLNNQLTDFSFIPSSEEAGLIANRAQPGKRPRSSMSPTIVFHEGRPVLAIGSPGGSRIIDYVARSLWDILERDLPVADAIARPHIVATGDGALELEADRFPQATVIALERLGHTVKEKQQTSGLHGIRIGKKGLEGGADPRREGTVRGR